MSSDHVIADAKTGKFMCEFCGAAEEPPFMPAPINVIIDAMDVFIAKHEACKAPAAETVMSDYVKGFDAGYSYVLNEIEVFIKTHEEDPRFIGPVEILMAQLKGKLRENT
jgi:hypothetical protein